jgi:hypothetical protein
MMPSSARRRAPLLVLVAAMIACGEPGKENPTSPPRTPADHTEPTSPTPVTPPAATDPTAPATSTSPAPPTTDPTSPTTSAVPAAPALAGLGPPSFTRVGRTGETFPIPLAVSLAHAVATDTFVAVVTTSAALSIPGGGVTIPAGQRSATVAVTGQAAGVAAVRASLRDTSFLTTVQVVADTERPRIASLTPASAALRPGGSQRLTLTLDLPARPGGEQIVLSLDPAAAGSLDPTATVAPDALEAFFVFTAGPGFSPATVTATAGESSASAALPIVRTGLVLNEIDYSQPGNPDAEEFVELLNAGPDPVDLGSLVVVLVGTGVAPREWSRFDLAPAGILAPGAYLVIAGARVAASVPSSVRVVPPLWDEYAIPDGGGALIMNDTSGEILDRVAYGNSWLSATIEFTGGPMVCTSGPIPLCYRKRVPFDTTLVEGTSASATSIVEPADAPGSVCRLPDGQDTDDTAADWHLCSTPTPGRANTP